MLVIRNIEEFLNFKKSWQGQSVGFVPTMGALHAGHAELLKKARSENQISVLSIFVNPTQFNDKKDFEKYPITFEADLQVARQWGVDVVFAPVYQQLYPDHYHFKMMEDEFSKKLCGQDRPGHFEGVLSVVMKLFQIVSPSRAYFGEKDFQQLTLIRRMVQAYFLPIEIVAVPTVRERDGLAMSSRNTRLSSTERQRAPRVYQIISQAPSARAAREQLQNEGFQVDYVEDLNVDDDLPQNKRRFAAVRLGEVRLIDNVQI